jgi:hypothetical protein
MKLMIVTAAALGALALAGCTPAADETADDAAATGADASTTVPATDGAMAPADRAPGATPEAISPVDPENPSGTPGQTPPTLPPEPDGSTSPATSSPPPK